MGHLYDKELKEILKIIFDTNDSYMVNNSENIKKFSHEQNPVATLVMCCDSRAHTTSFTCTPENNFFIVRNIGNQYILNQGSIDFGVRKLKTKLLIFLGHTNCGAINAAMTDYANLESSIIREIDHLCLSIHQHDLKGSLEEKKTLAVLNNVNQQVEIAINNFKDLLESDNIVIIGMVLDINNALKKGFGKVSIININGDTNFEHFKLDPIISHYFN
jgi:carbonic anhydrase